MSRLLPVLVLVLFLSGCVIIDLGGHEREARSGSTNVGVTENSADVQVLPGYKDGNVDVRVAWP